MSAGVSLQDYRALLAAPQHRWTLAWSAMARLPYAMISLVVLFYTQARSGSFGWAGALAGAMLIGTALGAVLQGKIIDAAGPVRPLLTASAAFLFCVLLLALAVEHQWPGPCRLLCAFGVGVCQPNVAAASRALWGRVVTDPGYIKTGAAYEALSLEAFFIIGPGLAGVFAIAGCTLTGLALCAALMAVGTIGFCRSALVRRWPAPRQRSEQSSSHPAGLRQLFGHKGLRALMTAATGLGICLGGVEVAIPAALRAQSSPGLGGLVLSGWTITSVLFALFYGTRPWPAEVSNRVPALLAAFAALIVASAVPRAPLGACALILIAGTLIAAQPTTYSLALQHVVPNTEVAEGFSWILTSMTVGAAVGQLVSGQIVEIFDARTALACVGLIGLGAAIAVAIQRAGLTEQHRQVRAETFETTQGST